VYLAGFSVSSRTYTPPSASAFLFHIINFWVDISLNSPHICPFWKL
jgi:hypothetical protein